MQKPVKREYLKIVGYNELPNVIAKMLNVDPDRLVYVTQLLIAGDKACTSFTLKDDNKNEKYFALINDFECHIYSDKKYDVRHKKNYAIEISEIIDQKRKMGATKLTALDYQQDYNDYHTQNKSIIRARKEEITEDLLF